MATLTSYQQEINAFRSKSEGNYIFACQAAVSLVVSTDLLYQLWNNFKQYQYSFEPGTTYKISHLAISDLLMSNLCREVGHDLYEIERNIRDILLTDLELLLGRKRKNTIAAFLKDYAQLEYRYGHRKNIRDIHELTAAAILDPTEMEKQIIERINNTENDAEKINYLMMHHNLLPLGFNSELKRISSGAASRSLSPILISENEPNAPGVLKVKLPALLRGKVRESKQPVVQEEEIFGTDALSRVRECLAKKYTTLDLGNCGLRDDDFLGTELDMTLQKCTHLESLILSNDNRVNEPGVAPGELVEEPQGNFLTRIPTAVTVLKLSVLICSGDHDKRWKITDVSQLEGLVTLTNLDLSNNELTNRSLSVIGQLSTLKTLNLFNNDITSTYFLKDLGSLVSLTLDGNQIEDISGLGRLTNLQSLYLADNRVSDISELQYLAALTVLNLDYNKIKTVDALGNLLNLQQLYLDHNEVVDVSPLKTLSQLEFLEINENRIKDISVLSFMPSLKSLIVQSNELSGNIKLDGLDKLEYLDISNNQITSLDDLAILPSLQHLLAANNEISSIDGMEDLPSLETFDLANNKITDLRHFLPYLQGRLRELCFVTEFTKPALPGREINIEGNPLVSPPMEIVKQGTAAILDYFNPLAKRQAPSQPVQTIADEPQTNDWLRIKVTEEGHQTDGTAFFRFSAYDLSGTHSLGASSSFIKNREMLETIWESAGWNAKLCWELSLQILPGEIREAISFNKNIIWIVDQNTSAYPWEMLQLATGDRSKFDMTRGMMRMIDTTTAGLLAETNDVYIVGDPDVEGSANQLDGAMKEAVTLERLLKKNGFKTHMIIGGSSTDIMHDLFARPYKIIHLAGHGVSAADTSSKATGMLIGRNSYLTVRDFEEMRSIPELVFINCTYSGRTGMAETLLQKGARAVIVIGGTMNDDVAVDFSRIFYECFVNGDSFGDSVKNARTHLHDKYPNNSGWGLYQCYGDPEYRLSKPAEKNQGQQQDINEAQLSQQSKLPIVRVAYSEAKVTGFFMEGATLHSSLQNQVVVVTWLPGFATPADVSVTFEKEGEKYEFQPNHVISMTGIMGIAILRFNGDVQNEIRNTTSGIVFYPIATTLPTLHVKEVSVIGHFGEDNSLRVADKQEALVYYADTVLRYSGGASNYTTGSPVLNGDGQLIGVHRSRGTAQYSGQNENEAIWIGAITEHLEKNIGVRKINVFFSYPTSTRQAVDTINEAVKELNEKNPNTQITLSSDLDIPLGVDFSTAITDMVKGCDVYVLLFDDESSEMRQVEYPLVRNRLVSTARPFIIAYEKVDHAKDRLEGDPKTIMDMLEIGVPISKVSSLDSLKSHFTQRISRLINNPTITRSEFNTAEDETVQQTETVEPATSYNQALPVVHIHIDKKFFACGFIVNGGSLHPRFNDELVVLTCQHIVTTPESDPLNPATIVVRFAAVTPTEFIPHGIAWTSLELDAAILRLRDEDQTILRDLIADTPPYTFATSLPSPDEEQDITMVARDQQGKVQVSRRKLLDHMAPYIHYTGERAMGSSGAPVFNNAGQLIGMHHAWSETMRRLHGNKGTYNASEAIWIGSIIEGIRETHIFSASIRIFADSLSGMREERAAIDRAIKSVKGRNKGIDIEIFWPPVEAFNNYQQVVDKISQADVFVLLLSEETKPYLESEFSVAYRRYLHTGTPSIYIYHKPSAAKTENSNRAFLDRLMGFDLRPISFQNPENLEIEFTQQLTYLLSKSFDPDSVDAPTLEDLANEYDYVLQYPAGSKYDDVAVTNIETLMTDIINPAIHDIAKLTKSKSAGQRVAATIALQKFPSMNPLEWIAQQIGGDIKYISERATLALEAAVTKFETSNRQELKSVVETAIDRLSKANYKDPKQADLLTQLLQRLNPPPGPQRNFKFSKK